jgi:hypothetical protein
MALDLEKLKAHMTRLKGDRYKRLPDDAAIKASGFSLPSDGV